ncbi:hypothetical protein [Bacillus chungangensis]|uniref:Phage protein n=1 Tax=Bacillus chungangensis TaxID=587633 RepID=A0ABT9WRP5_9BACI|nr:hypothetical protein [Bacillus chungangensis]MDQ0175971.1 hypothetical protein [Bacillus chungangensis]
MKTLKYDGEELKAERIIKNADSIIGYNGESEVFAFRGVKDFSFFKLINDEGNPEEIERELTKEEQLMLALSEAQIKMAEQEQTIMNLALAITDLQMGSDKDA